MDKYPSYISQERQILFERYLMDELPEEERQSFEKRLEDDKSLSYSFDEFKQLFRAVEEAGLRSRLNDFHNTLEKEEQISIRALKPTVLKFNFRLAAAFAILLSIGGFWFFNQQDSNEQLFDTYFSPDPGLPTVMGSNDNYAFYEAMVDYKQGNYDIAIEKWEKLLQEKPKNDTLNYFLGAAYLAKGEENEAIHFLEQSFTTNKSGFENEANYYLGMAYLKTKNPSLASKFLAKSNLDKSKQLLKQLAE